MYVLHKLWTGCFAAFVSYRFVFVSLIVLLFYNVLPVVENCCNIMSTSVTYFSH